MKKLSLFLSALSISLCSFSQVIVSLTSVPCNTGLEGSYPFTYAGELDGTSPDWNTPNIFLSTNAVAGSLEFINDSTSGMVTGVGVPPLVGVPKGYLGCDTLGNPTQDLTGKIAVIYRGACEYGLKAYNAQKRGAIGVIIINHTGDAVNMGGGTYGIQVNIPVVMIGRIAGDDLRLAIESCPPYSVTGFIGTKVGFYANDMSSSMGDILMPENLATPQHLAPNGTVFPVDLGLYAYNIGTNSQTGVTATVTVVRQSNGSTVYSQTSLPLNFNGLDSTFVDTQYIDLGTYAPSFWVVDTYTVTYSLNPTIDDDMSDNTFVFEFKITDMNNGGYSKSRTDINEKPIHTKSFYIQSSIPEHEFEICIVYRFPSSNNFCIEIDGLTFSCEPVGQTMTNQVVEIRRYEWNDIFTDLNTPPTFNNVQLVQSGSHIFADESENNQNIDVLFNPSQYVNIPPNQRYLFCVYSAGDSLKIGFDDGINYKATVENYLQPIAPVYFADSWNSNLPSGWYVNGFGNDVTPAIAVNFSSCVGIEDNLNNTETIPYPNPTANLLTIPIQKNAVGNVLVEVFDLTGKLVLSENKTNGNEPLKINVASIKNGAYLFNLTFADGTKEVFKISVNR
ncbi:MAG: T9SS type A sorting domain-containing protein [Bacteroidetes bacterium]|nr:T9SS type A sorting domain-containing protein [Bacteroidota bacterium]